jgi:formylglycine-generating enzyme required for sulfatase activity
MKKWQALLFIAILLGGLMLSVNNWLPPVLEFLGANAETLQSLDSVIAIILGIAAILAGIYAFLIKKKNEPSAPIATQEIETDGGAFIGENVGTAGGDFTGRDKINLTAEQIFIGDVAASLQEKMKSKLPAADLEKATVSYLEYLLNRHSYLSMKGLGTTADRVPIRLALLDLYVPLKARLQLPEGDTWKRVKLAGREMPEEAEQALRLSEPQPLLDILKDHDGVIILGDPGAGKTTFLKYLSLKLARGEGEDLGLNGRLPILLPLAAYANALGEKDIRLDDFIAAYFDETVAELPVSEMLTDALKNGLALILLDGLDEVKDLNLRNTVVERVMDFYAYHRRKGNKFLLTSRVVGYRDVRPAAENLAETTLVDFEDEEIEGFITRWTVALEKEAQGGDTAVARTDAEVERRGLLEAVQHNQGVRHLAANPLLLTILALMKRQGVSLPERRVQLYDRYVTTLLSSWNRARSLTGRAPGRDLDEEDTVRMLAPLALWMHEIAPGVGLVPRPDLQRKLIELFTARGEEDSRAASKQFLEDVHQHAALLLARGPEEYGFIHLTFEEYLAAVAIALEGQGDAELMAGILSPHIGEQAWREVTLLTVAYLGIPQRLPRVAGQVVEALALAKEGQPGEAAVLAGDAVLDSFPGGIPVESKDKVVRALVPTMQNAEVAPKTRQRAGHILGKLGWQPKDLDEFIKIPAGKFLYGDEKEEREIKNPFWMAKYPVTNLQFARFMEAGGYENKDWWSKDSWEYCQKNNWQEPRHWDDRKWNNPISPVVGVSWFEAEAYANWLNQQVLPFEKPENYHVALPTEEKWEYAARGTDGREYPWGNEFDMKFANTTKSGDIGTTAVCTYPQGINPFSLQDLSGNVFEWTDSWYNVKKNTRVLRGGSWISGDRYARCAYRRRSYPDGWYDLIGFRIIVSLVFR